jgi:hypothetical protein
MAREQDMKRTRKKHNAGFKAKCDTPADSKILGIQARLTLVFAGQQMTRLNPTRRISATSGPKRVLGIATNLI